MGNLIRLNSRIKPRTVDGLLEMASESHVYIHRLMAEARLTYGTNSETFLYVQGMLAVIEKYLNDSTRYLEGVQDRQAELSILGNLPIEVMEERLDKLTQRVKAYRAIHPKVVIAKRIS